MGQGTGESSVDGPESGGTLTSDLPKIKAPWVSDQSQWAMLYNLVVDS